MRAFLVFAGLTAALSVLGVPASSSAQETETGDTQSEPDGDARPEPDADADQDDAEVDQAMTVDPSADERTDDAEDDEGLSEEEPDEDRETFGDRFRRGDLFGYFNAQGRFFPQPAAARLDGSPPLNDYWFNGAMAWEPGFFMNVTDYMNFELILFGRVDQHDRNRTHGDIREGFFELFFNQWSFGFGVHRVFWGVTESKHLVDIINQTDLVEDFDTDIKLGQAMVTTSFTHDKAGTYSLYVMSWARPVVFPGPLGRPTLAIAVDNSLRIYQSRLKQGQVDVAFRWSHSMAGFDWGLSYFFGTTREPQLFGDPPGAPLPTALRPVYELIHQGGLDLQYTREGWLLKVETIVRGGQGPTFGAVTGGFEYTFYQVKGSIIDVGLILEYSYDGRDNNTFIILENDFFAAMRLSLSDVGSTEFLVGSFVDAKDGSVFIGAEASRRFGENWKIALEGRGYIPQKGNILNFFRNDSQIQVDIEFYY